MAHVGEKQPLLQGKGYNNYTVSVDSIDAPSLDSAPLSNNRLKPRHVAYQFSTIDCAIHPEKCPLVTGVGSLALDGGWGWMIVFSTMLCNFLLTGMSRTFGVVYPTIQERFHSSAAMTTAIQSISNSLRLFGAPISSSLSDIFGARTLVIIGGILQALGYALSLFAPNLYFLYFSMGFLTGIGGALTYIPTHILVNTYFNKKRGRALGIATSGIGIGTFLMAPIQTILLQKYSFVGYCVIMSAIVLNYIVAGALLRPLESNHASHKVKQVKRQRQKSIAEHRFMASQVSNPSIFYESIIYDPSQIEWQKALDLSDDNDPALDPNKNADISPKSYGAEDSNQTVWSQDKTPILVTAPKRKTVSISDTIAEVNEITPDPSTSIYPQLPEDNSVTPARIRQPSFTESVQQSVEVVSKKWTYFRKKFNLFTNLAFVLYCTQNMVLQFCTSAPLTFLPQLGMENGSSATAAAFLISVSGIFDIIGRYVFGFLFDIKIFLQRRRLLHGILGITLGTLTLSFGFTNDYLSMFLVAAAHGLVAGGYHAQKTSIVAEFVPITIMSDAVGFTFFFEGFGSLMAAPLFGVLVDIFDTYRIGYFFCGMVFNFFTSLVLLQYCITSCRR